MSCGPCVVPLFVEHDLFRKPVPTPDQVRGRHFRDHAQYTTTPRMLSPACIRSKPLLMSASGIVWVIIGSMWILPSMYQSTIFGTSVRPRAPPNAVPFHTRPVT